MQFSFQAKQSRSKKLIQLLYFCNVHERCGCAFRACLSRQSLDPPDKHGYRWGSSLGISGGEVLEVREHDSWKFLGHQSHDHLRFRFSAAGATRSQDGTGRRQTRTRDRRGTEKGTVASGVRTFGSYVHIGSSVDRCQCNAMQCKLVKLSILWLRKLYFGRIEVKLKSLF